MIKMYFWKEKIRGFTLIELMMSISILFLLFTLVNHGFIKKQRSMEFEIAKDYLYNQLYEAREHSRNFKDGSVYGVHLDTNKHEWFKWDTYSESAVIATSELPLFIEINSFAINGWGNDIIFEKNTGKTQNFGTFKMVSNDWEIIKFEINNQGLINKTYSEI